MPIFVHRLLLMQILRTRNILNVHGSDIHRGLSDIAFTSIDDSRLVKEAALKSKLFCCPTMTCERAVYNKFVQEHFYACHSICICILIST